MQKEGIAITTTSQSSEVTHSFGQKLRGYVALTKPRVLELLLVSTVPVMFLAAGGVPDLWLVLATVVGGAMSAASAASFNMYLDRDIDVHMKRTRIGPLSPERSARAERSSSLGSSRSSRPSGCG